MHWTEKLHRMLFPPRAKAQGPDLAEFERQLDANLAARRARRAARSEAAKRGWSTRRRTGHA